ncbi:MarR family transcriptional regulator [Parashewanella spongiae]|uniref:MarR family transcriptional regulator n=1 Tax=Parashewanella spongiae TaxID=342950 RepID=A0A3A6TTV8_9GAMM|nr:MarR family winged helix-turn-helix transcriptional regulator [Parashewanella spongiae]MCL1078142.1 MarR family winged helix-turn-helix transcriptional regulator [Parashewanella spongiae]RJY16345.1 MarR family transcriptional regulator [Parashewanella spongiae]
MTYNDPIDYLEALFTILRAEQKQLANITGLQSIHLQIVYYLGRCNRYSDSLKNLVDFIGQTKGTTSKSVSLLEAKGFLVKIVDLVDKRKVHLCLSKTGQQLAREQHQPWFDALKQLPSEQQSAFASDLNSFLKAIQESNQHQKFGVCESCKHLIRSDDFFRCGLTKETLTKSDLQKICVYHLE